jgi:DNA-binding PadR family transcriptional regulator
MSEVEEFISDFSRFFILTMLYEGPCHGYKILNTFQKRMKKKMSPSLVYPFLQTLEQRGLIKHTTKMDGERERKIYELTDEGRELCERIFRRFSKLVSVAIEPSLEICAHCGCKVYEGGYSEEIEGKMTMFCCVHCANSYKQEKNSIN